MQACGEASIRRIGAANVTGYTSDKAHKPATWHPWRTPKKGDLRPSRPAHQAETTRTCRTCGECKPLAAFTGDRTSGRKEVRCRACRNLRDRELRDRTVERERERASRTLHNVSYNAARRRRYALKHPRPIAPDRWLSCVRAGMELNLSAAMVRVLARAGKLVAVKTRNYPSGGLVWRIDPDSVRSYKYTGKG